MKWKTKCIKHIPQIGYKKIVRKFCFIPFKCNDNYTVWLWYRYEIFLYAYVCGINRERLLVKTIGWTKECVLSKVFLDLISKIATQHIKMPKQLN